MDNQRLDIMEILSVSTQKGIKVYAAKGDWALHGSLQSKVVGHVFCHGGRDRAHEKRRGFEVDDYMKGE